MPQFSPGEIKTAIAPIKAGPAGMNCQAELFLGPDDLTKIATSGRVPFVSAGKDQSVNVRLPVTMPSEEGSYHGYIDVFADGMRFLAYQATEDVTIIVPEPLVAGSLAVTDAALPSWCGPCWKLCSLPVTNQSNSPIPCSLALYARYYSSATDYEWTAWGKIAPYVYDGILDDYYKALQKYHELLMYSATLAPGETKIFSGVTKNMTRKVTGTPRQQVKFVGPFGEVLSSSFTMVEY